MSKGKRYLECEKLVDKSKVYSAKEALETIEKMPKAKFDETVELHVKLGVDSKHADQQVRGTTVLPNGTGKTLKVLVFAKGPKAEEATKAGADFVGDADLVEKIEKENWLDFDVIIATPEMMPEVGKIGNILGPRGLMPNPKTGTVTPKVDTVINDIKKGMVEYRTDSYGNIHTIIGKASFTEKALLENLKYVVSTISKSKPTSVKGTFVQGISISSTMGPGIKVDKNSFDF